MLAMMAETTVFGVVAGVCSLVACALAVLNHISGLKAAHKEAEVRCHERLLAEQRISEQLSTELHEYRMREKARRQ